ncbi:mRNA interferase YafQ [Sedimentisphaera salicampi]|nr:mRNA interferase YafQ [Sedimentisphaera salicampi]
MKISFHNQFKKDFRKVSKHGKDPRKLENVIELICSEAVLPDNYKDHSLKGSWGEFRELHIQPD